MALVNNPTVHNLVSLVENHPVLYDLSSPEYKNNKLKNLVWDDIAEALGENVKWCKDTWSYLRGEFFKKCAVVKKSGDPGDIYPDVKWAFFRSLLFLRKFGTPRNTCDNFGTQKQAESEEVITVDVGGVAAGGSMSNADDDAPVISLVHMAIQSPSFSPNAKENLQKRKAIAVPVGPAAKNLRIHVQGGSAAAGPSKFKGNLPPMLGKKAAVTGGQQVRPGPSVTPARPVNFVHAQGVPNGHAVPDIPAGPVAPVLVKNAASTGRQPVPPGPLRTAVGPVRSAEPITSSVPLATRKAEGVLDLALSRLNKLDEKRKERETASDNSSWGESVAKDINKFPILLQLKIKKQIQDLLYQEMQQYMSSSSA